MAQWVKTTKTRPNNPSSILSTHMMKEENQLPQVVLIAKHAKHDHMFLHKVKHKFKQPYDHWWMAAWIVTPEDDLSLPHTHSHKTAFQMKSWINS